MNTNKNVLWITLTAIFIALLVVLQAATASLGNTLVTGSVVNFILIISVMTCGLKTGLPVAIISPVTAKFFGIGPFWAFIPFIAAGNCMLVLVWRIAGNLPIKKKIVSYVIALIAAAIAKFLVVYFGIVKVAIPLFMGLPEAQAAVVSSAFSLPQLFTASMGGALAILILPVLRKALGK